MLKKYGAVMGMVVLLATAAQAEEQAPPKEGGASCCHLPGGNMLFNPSFGDDIYHNHPAGMWMFNYKYMHMGMDGLRDGTTDVDTSSVGNGRGLPYDNIMMIPTSMRMDMQMVMAMYGVNDRLTVMGMVNYLETKMKMRMDMSPLRMNHTANPADAGAVPDDPMSTRGLGDTELRGIYKFADNLNASLGVSLPTGDIDQDYITSMASDTQNPYHVPYDMQLGSGTFDLKPAVTMNFLSADAKWNWGGQAMATIHLGDNANDYSLGDSLKLNTWLQRALGPAATWVRLSYSNTASIDGSDPEIQKALNLWSPSNTTGNYKAPSMPDANPDNYGGQKIDGFVGVSIPMGPFSLGVEGGIPLYQNLNGLQMKSDWYLTAGLQAMF